LRLLGLNLDEARYTTSVKPLLQFDMRNNRLFPSAGYFFEVRSEFASAFFGSSLLAEIENQIMANEQNQGISGGLYYRRKPAQANFFSRFGVNGRVYYNFDSWFWLRSWVLKMNVDFGFLNTYGQNLISENFRMGGQGTLRGYYYQSIGPVGPVSRNQPNQHYYNFVAGGNKQVLMNLELEFPLLRMLGLNGVLFYDMGNVYGADEGLFYINTPNQKPWTKNLSLGLYKSIGFGVRWQTPMGLIRLEWGIPINPRPAGTPGAPRNGDAGIQFDFNIGQSF
jgi:outer membrane protein insertion porin family